jgi:hypothetical protein
LQEVVFEVQRDESEIMHTLAGVFNDWNVGLENHHLRSGTGRGELVISRDTIHIGPTSYL